MASGDKVLPIQNIESNKTYLHYTEKRLGHYIMVESA